MHMNPLVSVVVTTYNQAPYIQETLTNVFAQTYKNYEVIVVDDGSTDDTAERIQPFLERINYIRQKNEGLADSRNTGIRNARGELLAFLDGDDLWEPQKLAKQVLAAKFYPSAGLIVVDGVQFSKQEILNTTLLDSAVHALFPDSQQIVAVQCYETMFAGNPIFTTSQVMIPARVLDRVGFSNRCFLLANDYDLYLRIAQHYEVVFIRESLVRWRYLPTSASGPRQLRSLRWNEETLAVQRWHLARTPRRFKDTFRRFIRARLRTSGLEAYYYGRCADRVLAAKYLLRLFAHNPSSYTLLGYLLALWCPSWLGRVLGPAGRKLLGNR